MKTADELFNELGYVKKVDNQVYCEYIKYEDYDGDLEENKLISFSLINKKIRLFDFNCCTAPEITMQELKAINKFCEERGWI